MILHKQGQYQFQALQHTTIQGQMSEQKAYNQARLFAILGLK